MDDVGLVDKLIELYRTEKNSWLLYRRHYNLQQKNKSLCYFSHARLLRA